MFNTAMRKHIENVTVQLASLKNEPLVPEWCTSGVFMSSDCLF